MNHYKCGICNGHGRVIKRDKDLTLMIVNCDHCKGHGITFNFNAMKKKLAKEFKLQHLD